MKGYLLGKTWGHFKDDDGNKVEYRRLYISVPFPPDFEDGPSNVGMQAVILGCPRDELSIGTFNSIMPGDYIDCDMNQKGKCIALDLIKTVEDLAKDKAEKKHAEKAV